MAIIKINKASNICPDTLIMAQSLLITCSDLQLQPLRSSLISTSLPLRQVAFAALPRRRRAPALVATQSTIIQPTPPSQDDTKPINSDENSTAQISSQGNAPAWAKYVLAGSVILIAIPFCRKALKIQDVSRRVDSAVEMVQTVAEVAEKAAEEISEALPNGELKKAALKLEHIASLVNKNAVVADSFIDKVDDAMSELDKKLQSEEEELKTKDAVENKLLEASSALELKKEIK